MSEKVLCPYCGSEMGIKVCENVDGYTSWSTCYNADCYADGPICTAKSREAAFEAAHAAALRRYTPPIKPMTLEEVIALSRERGNIVYVECNGGRAERNIYNGYREPKYEAEYCMKYGNRARIDFYAPGCKMEKTAVLQYYGKTWRCWERKPTETEMREAAWEK